MQQDLQKLLFTFISTLILESSASELRVRFTPYWNQPDYQTTDISHESILDYSPRGQIILIMEF